MLACKDKRIAELCEQITDQNALKQELEQSSAEVHKMRESYANEQERITRQLSQLEDKNESITQWFTHRVQELEIQLHDTHEELILSRQHMKESEKIRKQRLQQMLSGRSMGDQAALHAPRDSELSQEDEEDGAASGAHFNTESLIE